MPISTTTFEERLERIGERAKIADRAHAKRRRSSLPRPGPMIVMAAMGTLMSGAAFAWDGDEAPYDWALPSVQWVLSLLP